MKRALITGITGQDGAYLAKFLLEKGYKVFGTFRRLSTPNFWRLQALEIFESVTLIPADITDFASIVEAIKIAEPDEIYNLAAQSFVGASFEQPMSTAQVSGLGVTTILEAVRIMNPAVKFYQASTSELYGNSRADCQDESSPFRPASPYAAAKMYGYNMVQIYREAYGLFACNGILFNHESPLRGLEFVTRKVSNAVARIVLGLQRELRLGNLEARRDWGYAPEYVEAMWMMLQQPSPDDYVIATGESHSVRELVQRAFAVVDLDWQKWVRVDERLVRPLDPGNLRGNAAKARRVLGWEPRVTFEQLVEIMVQEDLRRWKSWLSGERFPWDAVNYPDEANVLTGTPRV
jgi:GDPmannose 4,6-dehydratase